MQEYYEKLASECEKLSRQLQDIVRNENRMKQLWESRSELNDIYAKKVAELEAVKTVMSVPELCEAECVDLREKLVIATEYNNFIGSIMSLTDILATIAEMKTNNSGFRLVSLSIDFTAFPVQTAVYTFAFQNKTKDKKLFLQHSCRVSDSQVGV
jgi:hypothetical protein